MKFDRIVRFVDRCRKRMSGRGCRDCGTIHPHGLFLHGTPGLREMVRAGAQPRELKAAMRERGWYCRKCVNRRKRLFTAAVATLRDQFATREEYLEYLNRHRGPGASKGI